MVWSMSERPRIELIVHGRRQKLQGNDVQGAMGRIFESRVPVVLLPLTLALSPKKSWGRGDQRRCQRSEMSSFAPLGEKVAAGRMRG
jgi:hypothetical protein